MINAIIAVRSDSQPEITLNKLDRLREFAQFTGQHVIHEQVLNPHESVDSIFGYLSSDCVLLIEDCNILGDTQEGVLSLLRKFLNQGLITIVIRSDSERVVIDV